MFGGGAGKLDAPRSQLPQYRAQVLHRLPRLRSLDAEQAPDLRGGGGRACSEAFSFLDRKVSPEERVKTEVIYGASTALCTHAPFLLCSGEVRSFEVLPRTSRGADVETRREIFEQLLPEETFVDRRLMTEAGSEAETERLRDGGERRGRSISEPSKESLRACNGAALHGTALGLLRRPLPWRKWSTSVATATLGPLAKTSPWDRPLEILPGAKQADLHLLAPDSLLPSSLKLLSEILSIFDIDAATCSLQLLVRSM